MAGDTRPGRCRNHDTPSALRARCLDDLEPCDYWLVPHGRWVVYTPAPECRLIALRPTDLTVSRKGDMTAEPAGSRWRLVKGRWYTDEADPQPEGDAA